jgi:hypothetical protein
MRGVAGAIALLGSLTVGCSSGAPSTNEAPTAATGPAPQPAASAVPPPDAAPADAEPAAAGPTKQPAAPAPPKQLFVPATVEVSSDSAPRARQTPLLGRAWCEGVRGDGVGQAVTIVFAEPTAISSVGVTAGVADGARVDRSDRHNLPTALALTIDGEAPMKAEVDRTNGDTAWTLEPARKVTRLRVSFAAVERRRKRTSCLSDLQLADTNNSTVYPLVAPKTAMAALPEALARVTAALDSCDRNALAEVATFPVTWVVQDEGYELPQTGAVRSAGKLAGACSSIEPDHNKPGLVEMKLEHLTDGRGAEVVFRNYATVVLRWTKTGWKLSGIELDMM